MIRRENYINKISKFIDSEQIKIITGIRRSGKSFILKLLIDELKNRNISEEQIIYINFESLEFMDLLSYEKLYKYIKEKQIKKKMYLFFDEIQEVQGWERAINSMRVDFNCDIYITGSNSKLLSGELATYIAGRYVQFEILPLSYKEYLEFIEKNNIKINKNKLFERYMINGGFPTIYTTTNPEENINTIIKDIYTSIILKDIVTRNKIRNIALLEKILKFIFENIGNTFSAKKVSDYLKSQNRKIDIETIYNYIKYLEEAYIIYRVPRYDLKGKEVLQTNEKFYASDIGLKTQVFGFKDEDIPEILENIVFLELLRRNYKVYVGKKDNLEIDFVCEKSGKKIYIQVCYRIDLETTLEREIKPLLDIKDNYPKYIVTADKVINSDYEGIQKINIEEFLLNENL